MLFDVLHDGLFAAVAALGFALIFYVPKKYLPYVALTAMTAYGARTFLTHIGVMLELSTFFAAFCIGVAGRVFAHMQKEPHQAISIAACIPMVPGSFAFKAILSLMDFVTLPLPSYELLTTAAYYAFKTTFILAAIAFGVAAPSLVKR